MKMHAIFVAVTLAGCAGNQAPLPVMPTIPDVAATQSQLSTITDPQGFFRTAAAQIIANCGGYFDQHRFISSGALLFAARCANKVETTQTGR